MKIVTEDDIKLEMQVTRCKMAIEDYFRESVATVNREWLYGKLTPEPLLFQFAHMIAFLKIHWRDALRWCLENRGAIMIHAVVDLNEQESNATAETDGTSDRDASLPPHKG